MEKCSLFICDGRGPTGEDEAAKYIHILYIHITNVYNAATTGMRGSERGREMREGNERRKGARGRKSEGGWGEGDGVAVENIGSGPLQIRTPKLSYLEPESVSKKDNLTQ